MVRMLHSMVTFGPLKVPTLPSMVSFEPLLVSFGPSKVPMLPFVGSPFARYGLFWTIKGSKVAFRGLFRTFVGTTRTIEVTTRTIEVTTRTIKVTTRTIERGRRVFLAKRPGQSRWRRAKLPPRPARDFPALPETRYLLAVAADSGPHTPLDAWLLRQFARFDDRGSCTLNLVAVVDGVNSR